MNVFEVISTILGAATVPVTTPISPNKIAQAVSGVDPYPALVYHQITSTPNNTKSTPVQVDEVRFQIDALHTKYYECCALTQSVRDALENYPYKQSKSATVAGVTIQQIFFLGQQDGAVLDEAGNPAYDGLYLQHMDFLIRIINN